MSKEFGTAAADARGRSFVTKEMIAGAVVLGLLVACSSDGGSSSRTLPGDDGAGGAAATGGHGTGSGGKAGPPGAAGWPSGGGHGGGTADAGAGGGGGGTAGGGGAGTGGTAGGGGAGTGGTAGGGGAGTGGTAGTGGNAGTGGQGACDSSACEIAGSCVAPGTPDPNNPCRVCLPSVDRKRWVNDPANVTCSKEGAWHSVARVLATTPYGHETAVCCHNCYDSSLTGTLDKIHAAMVEGADLIELDVSSENGSVIVHHDDGTSQGPALASVLSDPKLRAGNQMLFIESKETSPTEAYVSQLLKTVQANGLVSAKRPLFLRAFLSRIETLVIARRLLATPAFSSIRNYVRLHVLFSASSAKNIASLQSSIASVRGMGMHGVEFDFHSPNLFGAIDYAESLGLETALWTIPKKFGEVFIASLRDEADALITDYSISTSKRLIASKSGLFYLDVWNQPASGSTVKWYGRDAHDVHSSPVGGTGQPTLHYDDVGEDRFGTSLKFESSKKQFLATYDADNVPAHGYLVAAYVNFDKLELPRNTTQEIVAKSNNAAFAFGLQQPNSYGLATRLRFLVNIGGKYYGAYIDRFALDESSGFYILGAYDGDGKIRLWVNGSDSKTYPSKYHKGGATQNNVPLTLGADPEVGTNRFFFDGYVQWVVVQDWPDKH